MSKEQFEKDAEAMKKGFSAGPLSPAYRKMYADKKASDTDAKAEPKPAIKRPMGGNNPANKEALEAAGMKCGGTVKKYAKGGSVRGDGAAQRGKTRGKVC